jgi:hypothetical protein
MRCAIAWNKKIAGEPLRRLCAVEDQKSMPQIFFLQSAKAVR